MTSIPQTIAHAMKMQARFENAKPEEENERLFEWLCAEIAHANIAGIDWVQSPSRPVESLQDYNTYKLFARTLATVRAVAPARHIKVA